MSSRAPQSQRLYPLDMLQPYPDCQSMAFAHVIEPFERDGDHYAGMCAVVECNGMQIPAVVETVVRINEQASERQVTQVYGQCKPQVIQVARQVMRESCTACPVAALNR